MHGHAVDRAMSTRPYDLVLPCAQRLTETHLSDRDHVAGAGPRVNLLVIANEP